MTASRRVLVTGGASGLGKEVAEAFLRTGARVLITDIDSAAGESTCAELAGAGGVVEFRALDVTDGSAWADAVQWCTAQWGGLDILVNNAGVAAAGRFERIPASDWDWILRINLMGVVAGCRAVTPMFKQAGSGHIVNIASMAGVLNVPGMASYNVSKAGVISLSDTLRHELAPYGIRTTVVCPSFFATNLGDRMRSPDPAMVGLMGKLMKSSKVTAADVAKQIVHAVDHGKYRVITHPDARRAVLVQRFAPALAARQLVAYWAKLRPRLEGAD
ncbi:SDR family oxidoreductase [Lolliginicoccus levis]|uniref:SDR family oxidoreductase n=1 Tax=Lolliginicoccus levis TaxID=2919542 RepID=UPI00241E4571|nr:SDR family oxidoreductase [Lolliginicoccus levis]